MLKTLARANRVEHERFRVPHSAQDIVPVSRIWEDGLFLYNGKFSRTLRMSDINYQTASKADKKRMLEGYCDVINTVDCGMTAQITIINHPFDRRHFEQSLRMQESADGFDAYRTEFNSRLSANLAECNGIVQDVPDFEPVFLGLENYRRMFSDPLFIRSVQNTMLFAFVTVFFELVLGVMFAMMLSGDGRGARIMRSIMLVPMIMAPVAAGTMWRMMLDKNTGIVNYLFTLVGMPAVDWLGNPVLAMVSIMMVDIWRMGFFQEVPKAIEESGMIDGCSMARRFFLLVLPVVKPGLIASSILTFVGTWNEFLFAAILSVRKAKTLPAIIAGFITDRGLEWGPMAATGVTIIVPVFILVWLLQKDFVQGLTLGSVKG